MTGRNVLVLLLEEGHESQLQHALAERGDGTPSVHVVATDKDAGRIEAEARVLQTEWALRDEAEVEGEAGEADPVLAVEDAPRISPADEILLVGGGARDGGVERSLRELGLPVTRLPAGEQVRARWPLCEAGPCTCPRRDSGDTVRALRGPQPRSARAGGADQRCRAGRPVRATGDLNERRMEA